MAKRNTKVNRSEHRQAALRDLSVMLSHQVAHFLPDEISELAKRQGAVVRWQRLDAYETLTDDEVLASLGSFEPANEVWVVTDSLLESPVRLPVQYIPKYVAIDYSEQIGERFFNGDVVIFDCESRLVLMFHHEGLCTRFVIPVDIQGSGPGPAT